MTRMETSHKMEIWLLIISLVLGVLAFIVGHPESLGRKAPNWKEINQIADQKIPTINILQLAGWIMEKRADYILFDLRKSEKFIQYHIPTAINLDLGNVKTEVNPDVTVIVYTGDGNIIPHDWENLVKIYGKKLHLLQGGLGKWLHQVLFPDLTRRSGFDKKEVLRRKKISLFFGGRPKLPAFMQKNQGLIFLREGC